MAVILAGGLAFSVISLVIGVVVAAIQHGNTASSLSENESQVLTAAFGGMIGVLGAWVGYQVRDHRRGAGDDEGGWPDLQPPTERTLPHWPDRPTQELPPKPKEER